jgi:glycosyltransferase involved in cell wall biosynthesis
LLEEVEQSILAPGIVESRLIPYGVDLSVFHPADRQMVRRELAIPDGTSVLLFAANGVLRNRFKHYEMIRSAVAQVSERLQKVLFIALGEGSPVEQIGRAQVRFVPYETDVGKVANYFQAADLYVHAAKTDTFPKVILEALGCGIPVVATAVGGIPEQIKGLHDCTDLGPKWNLFESNEATGVLVPCGDSNAMTVAIERLLKDKSLRSTLGNNAAQDARRRFDLKREARAYLDWYEYLVRTTST